MQSDKPTHSDHLRNDFDDFFEHSLCGHIIAGPNGQIERVNQTLLKWLGQSFDAIKKSKFSDLLSIGGKIYYETHLWPLLRMQGYFDEVAVELVCADGSKLPVLINALERRNEEGQPHFIRFTVFKAADRRSYEKNLKETKVKLEKTLANAMELSILKEQFIAILGHDLRNPLGSVVAGIGLLSQASLPDREAKLVNVVRRSAARMSELIANTMDFARSRLGGGIVLNAVPTELEPVLTHVVDELRSVWPEKTINTKFDLPEPVKCDASRISQLLSNLISNAITHGSATEPVLVTGLQKEDGFVLSVCNAGTPIEPDHIDRLFEPFTRESTRNSQNGLGLGLYISQQISNAHGGQLTVTSDSEQTCFTFTMPIV